MENSSGIFQVEEDKPMKERKNGLKARRDTGGLGSVVDKQRDFQERGNFVSSGTKRLSSIRIKIRDTEVISDLKSGSQKPDHNGWKRE